MYEETKMKWLDTKDDVMSKTFSNIDTDKLFLLFFYFSVALGRITTTPIIPVNLTMCASRHPDPAMNLSVRCFSRQKAARIRKLKVKTKIRKVCQIVSESGIVRLR